MRHDDAHPRVIEVLRLGEQDDAWLEQHPEVLDGYRGEWVVIHQGRVVAHALDGRELARLADARRYPGSTLLRVPTREEAAAVHIL